VDRVTGENYMSELRMETYTIPDFALDELLKQGTEIKESFIYYDENDSSIAAVDEWLIGVTVRYANSDTEKFFHISEPDFIAFNFDDEGIPFELNWVISKEVFTEKCPRAARWVEVENYQW